MPGTGPTLLLLEAALLLTGAALEVFTGAIFFFAAGLLTDADFLTGAVFFVGLLTLVFLTGALRPAVFFATGFFTVDFFFAVALGFAAFFLTAM